LSPGSAQIVETKSLIGWTGRRPYKKTLIEAPVAVDGNTSSKSKKFGYSEL